MASSRIGLIGDGVEREHLAETVAPRGVAQVPHQQRAKAAMLPVVGYRHRAFAVLRVAAGAAAAHADLAQRAAVVRQRHVGHALAEIQVDPLVEQRRAGLADLARKAEAARWATAAR